MYFEIAVLSLTVTAHYDCGCDVECTHLDTNCACVNV